jgi:outer membrane lipoprotein
MKQSKQVGLKKIEDLNLVEKGSGLVGVQRGLSLTVEPESRFALMNLNHAARKGGHQMVVYRFPRWVILSVFLAGAFSCAYPISSELRNEVSEGITFPMVLQNPTAYAGKIVLWGGQILEMVNYKEGSDIIVLDTPLDYQERPEAARYSRGRFIARSPTFLDPAIYRKGKKITLAGEIVGKETKPLGKVEYAYPVVLVKQLHLWEPRYYGPYYYPYWGWPYYGPYRGYWGYGPYYGHYDWDFDGDFDNDSGGWDED